MSPQVTISRFSSSLLPGWTVLPGWAVLRTLPVWISVLCFLSSCSPLFRPTTKRVAHDVGHSYGKAIGSMLRGIGLQSPNAPDEFQDESEFSPPSQERLAPRLPPVEIALTPEVSRELNRYLQVHREGLGEIFERRDMYLPMMEAIFKDEGLPHELLALPIIESGFNPQAQSPVGARGLWQFMPGTARSYGLRVNSKVDERLDPILSTIAAARFLRDLYEEQGDWHLALAAYNAGSGGISRAMQRTRSKDYWQLARASAGITKQTQQFVPKFIAAAVIARRWNRYDAVELAADPGLLLIGMLPQGVNPDA